MFETKFDAREIPYHEFEKVGLSKEDVLKKLPHADLTALLTGRRSGFVRIDVEGMKIDVKTSLHRNEDKSVSLRFHPINREAPNIYNLTEEQQSELKTDWIDSLVIEGVKENGEKAEMLVQYDPDTKEYVSAFIEDIPIPEKINDEELSEQQKTDWKRGLYLILNEEPVRVSLTDVYGFAGKIFMFALDGGISLAVSHLLANRTVEMGAGATNSRGKGRSGNTSGSDDSVTSRQGRGAASSGDSAAEQSNASGAERTASKGNASGNTMTNERTGTLIDHGPAPYKNIEGERKSYFVTLERGGKESTIWGVGLATAIEQSGAERGDNISLKSEGKNNVTVPKEKRDEAGNVVSTENIETHRNEWSISNSSRSVRR